MTNRSTRPSAASQGSVVLPGSVAVVTGCTRGFGRVLAEQLAERGVTVVVSGLVPDESEQLASALTSRGLSAVASPGNVTRPDDVAALVRTAVDELGRLDLWINNAAYESPGMRAVEQMPSEVFEGIQRVNALGTYRCTMAAITAMRPAGRGVVVNITGRGDDLRPARFTAAYAASKAWIRSFTRSVAAETRDSGVRVIGFNPGIMATERLDIQKELTDVGVDGRTLKLFAVVSRALADPPDVAAEALLTFLEKDPSSLKKELRLITPGRVAQGVGSEVRRAGERAVSRVRP